MLTLGFGALLVLIAVAGAYALVVLSKERSAETRVRDAYLRRDSLIEQIRSGIYTSGTIVRDYLLASPDTDIQTEMDLWRRVRARTDQVIQDYSTQTDKRDFSLFKVLSSDLASYWALQQSVLDRPMTQKDGPFYSGEMRQRRRETLAVADRLNALHAQELLADDAELKANFQEARFRLLVVVAACLLFGIALAGYTIRRTLQLEAEIEARYAEGVRARQEAQELSARLLSAQEEERRAISRELHDEVGQSLSALLMEAGNAAARVKDRFRAKCGRHVDSIKRLAEASVQVIRNMTLLLRPSMLDDFGLVPALEWQAREVSKRTGLRCLGGRRRIRQRACPRSRPRASIAWCRKRCTTAPATQSAERECGSAQEGFGRVCSGGRRRRWFRCAARPWSGARRYGGTGASSGRGVSGELTARRGYAD